jgi:hypothetical protein
MQETNDVVTEILITEELNWIVTCKERVIKEMLDEPKKEAPLTAISAKNKNI